MTSPFRKVTAGQSINIHHKAYNAMLDAAQLARSGVGFPGQSRAEETRYNATSVLVRNNSGANVSQYEILGIDGVLIAPTDSEEEFRNAVMLDTSEPADADHIGKFCVTLQPINDGEDGLAVVAGMVQCKVYFAASDDGHTTAGVYDGTSSYLEGGGTGASIIWRDTGSGSQWAVVNLGAGGGSCDPRNEQWAVYMFGSPTGGDFDMGLTINSTLETLTFNYNDTAGAAQTKGLTHTELASGDLVCSGGPWPDSPVIFTFGGNQASTSITIPTLDFSGLTGGSGVGVFVARWTPGYAG